MSSKNILTLMLVALLGMSVTPSASALACYHHNPVLESTVDEVESRLFEVNCPPGVPGVPPTPDVPDEDDVRAACEDADAYIQWVDSQFPQFEIRGLPCEHVPDVPDAPDAPDLREACDDADHVLWTVDREFDQFAFRGLPCYLL